MNLEVFREQDTVWIHDTDTDDEWPLPAEAIDAAMTALLEEGWELPFMARVRDYPDLSDLKAADAAATLANREALVRVLAAAIPFIYTALPPVWGPVSAGQVGASARDTPDGRGT